MSNLVVPIAIWSAAPSHSITSVHIIKDTNLVATGSRSGQVCIWESEVSLTTNVTDFESENGKVHLNPRSMCILGHSAPVTAITSCSSFRGYIDVFISVSMDGTLCIWDQADGVCKERSEELVPCSPTRMVLLSDNRHVACAGNHTEVIVIDLHSLKIASRLQEHDDWVCDLFSCNSNPENNDNTVATAGGTHPNQESSLRSSIIVSLTPGGVVRLWSPERDFAHPVSTVCLPAHALAIRLAPGLQTFIVVMHRRCLLFSATNTRQLLDIPCPDTCGWMDAAFVDKWRVVVWSQSGAAHLYELPIFKGLAPLNVAGWSSSNRLAPTEDSVFDEGNLTRTHSFSRPELDPLSTNDGSGGSARPDSDDDTTFPPAPHLHVSVKHRVVTHSGLFICQGDDTGRVTLWKVPPASQRKRRSVSGATGLASFEVTFGKSSVGAAGGAAGGGTTRSAKFDGSEDERVADQENETLNIDATHFEGSSSTSSSISSSASSSSASSSSCTIVHACAMGTISDPFVSNGNVPSRAAASTSTITATLILEDDLLFLRGHDNGDISIGSLPCHANNSRDPDRDDDDAEWLALSGSIAAAASCSSGGGERASSSRIVRGAHGGRVLCLMSPRKSVRASMRLRTFVSGGEDCAVRVWNLDTLQLLHTFAQHSGAVIQLVPMPAVTSSIRDLSCFFSISRDKSVGLFSLHSMSCRHVFSGHVAPVVGLRLRLDQDYLLVACADDSVALWELSTGQQGGVLGGQRAHELLKTCEDLCKGDNGPKMLQSRPLSAMTVTCAPDDAPIQLLLLNVKRMVLELKQILDATAAGPSWTIAAQSPAFLTFSFLIPWGFNERLDEMCREHFNLNPPEEVFCCGLRGCDGAISLTLPPPPSRSAGRNDATDLGMASQHEVLRWASSPQLTALHMLSGVTLVKVLLAREEFKNTCSFLLSAYTALIPALVSELSDEAEFVDPSLFFMARYWQDPVADVMQAARVIFSATIDRQSLKFRTNFAKVLSAQLTSESARPGAKAKAARLIVLGILGSDKPDSLTYEQADQVSHGLQAMLFHEGAVTLQSAAAELLGRGFSTWRVHLMKDIPGLLQRLFNLVVTSPPLKPIALTALLQIGAKEPGIFVLTLTEKRVFSPTEHAAALRVIASLVKTKAEALLPQVTRLAEGIVYLLDPNDPDMRGALLKSATLVLHSVVSKYPMISFHQETQRLAVGSSSHSISIYDLKSATKWHVLEGHVAPLTALAFSDDGRHLASYSSEESVVRFWQTTTSFFGFGSSPHCMASFPVQQPARPRLMPLQLLESVKLQWSSPEVVQLARGGEETIFLSIV